MDFPKTRHDVKQSGDDGVVFRRGRADHASGGELRAGPDASDAGVGSQRRPAHFGVYGLGGPELGKLHRPIQRRHAEPAAAQSAARRRLLRRRPCLRRLGRFGPPSPEMVIDLTGPPREPTALGPTPRRNIRLWSGTLRRWRKPACVFGIGGHRAGRGRRPQRLFGRVGSLRKRCAATRRVLRPRPGGEPDRRRTSDADLAFRTGSGVRIDGPTNLSLGWQGANAVLTWTSPRGWFDAGCLRDRGWFRRPA